MPTSNYILENRDHLLHTVPTILRRPQPYQLPQNGLSQPERLPNPSSQPQPRPQPPPQPRLQPQPTPHTIQPTIPSQPLVNRTPSTTNLPNQQNGLPQANSATPSSGSVGEARFDCLPANLNINFSKWFFGDSNDIKSKSRDTIKPLIDDYLRAQINSKLEVQNVEFLTQNLDACEPSSLSHFKRYSFTLAKKIDQPNLVGARKNKKHSKKSSNTSKADQPEPTTSTAETAHQTENISLVLQSNVVIIDRRPFFKKRNKLNSNNLISQDKNTDSLIAQTEDCDDSEDDMEIIEIDCDTCPD